MNHKSQQVGIRFNANEYPLKPGNRLIEASAGTGKTFALAHLVLRLITEGNHSINEILVVTFTEASAAELKARISERLSMALEGLETTTVNNSKDEVLKEWLESYGHPANRRSIYASRLLEALDGLDRADITTIHGFCRRTILRNSLESETPIRPSLEGDSKQLIIETVHAYWKEQVLGLHPEDLKGLIDAGLSIENLEDNLTKIDSDPSLELKRDIVKLNASEQLANYFEQSLDQLWGNFVAQWRTDGKALELGLRDFATYWRNQGLSNTKPFSPKPKTDRYQLINEWIEELKLNKKNLIKEDKIYYGDIRAQKILGNYYHPGIFSAAISRNGEKSESLSNPILHKAIADLWDKPAELVWCHALHWTYKTLNERRKEIGVMSYGDLIRTLDPLPATRKSSPQMVSQLLKKVRNKYRVALIDEFQDTDPVQWRILKQAFGLSSEHLLLMVGDPKQAIYSFRGGDLNTYINVRNEVDRIDVLVENFRASSSLMNALNKFMAPGLIHSQLKVPALISRADEDPRTIPDEQHPLKLITVNSIGDVKKEACSVLQPKSKVEELIPVAVANCVLDVLKNQTQITPSDICVLVSRHSQAEKIRSSLAKTKLPSRLVSQGDVLTSKASRMLQWFLNCLASPSNTKAIRLVACSDLMQWSAKRLTAAEVSDEIDELSNRFRDWSNSLNRKGLLGCLGELLESETIANLSERGRMLGDLQQCAQLVQEAIHLKELDATGAARWLRQQRIQPSAPVSDNRQPNSDVSNSAINIVTIHRSKGLEYRVVICPYLWEAPPIPKGPLWRIENEKNWLIALNNNWGAGKIAFNKAKISAIQEAERLSYVAMTRAKYELIIFWALAANQEGNPLSNFIFGNKSSQERLQRLSHMEMKSRFLDNDIPITLSASEHKQLKGQWVQPQPTGSLSLGPLPQRRLEKHWGRSSYSSWIANLNSDEHKIYLDPIALEEGKDTDLSNKELPRSIENERLNNHNSMPSKKNLWPINGPLAKFPRGTAAGECLHKILERIEYTDSPKEDSSKQIIEEELLKAGLDCSLTNAVQEGLSNLLSTPIGGPLGNLSFDQINTNRGIREMRFDLPLAHEKKPITAIDIANTFRKNPLAKFSANYAKEVESLKVISQGFLTGSIDLVFADNENTKKARWWVTDWKSNWVGNHDSEGNLVECGPHNYSAQAMENQMVLHHYPLQAHLYLVALHRFLKWRLRNYSPFEHLGGYIYVFLRGVPGSEAMSQQNNKAFTPGLIVEKAPIERVLLLDQVLKEGGK